LLAVAVILAGCGGSGVHKSPPQHVVPRPPVARSHAPQLVSMRRTDGATWETVIVRSDGTGDVGVFIGERAGTHHRDFELAPGALSRLRVLVAGAARGPQAPGWGSSTPSAVYSIFAQHRYLETARGHVPRRLAGLVGVLNGLIDHYS
jgi:hypothetical protein